MNHKRLFRFYREVRLMVRRRGGPQAGFGHAVADAGSTMAERPLVAHQRSTHARPGRGRRLDTRIPSAGAAFAESFIGRLREELLNETLFRSLPHARVALDVWRAGLPAASFAARLAKPRHLRCATAVRCAELHRRIRSADRRHTRP